MERKPRVLVLGATGQVGRAVVSHLRDSEAVAVTAAARDVGKARGLGVPVVHLDLDKVETLRPARSIS